MKEIILSAIVGIISAILTAKLSLRKVYSEKWWDKKEKAYTEIIEALYEIMQYFEFARDEAEQNRESSDKTIIKYQEKYSIAYWKLKKATTIGEFIILSEGARILNELKTRPKLSYRNNAPWDIYQDEYEAHKEALDKIIKIAKNDLKSTKYYNIFPSLLNYYLNFRKK
jgi:hypothetical protein